jgi:hypothetical protein
MRLEDYASRDLVGRHDEVRVKSLTSYNAMPHHIVQHWASLGLG